MKKYNRARYVQGFLDKRIVNSGAEKNSGLSLILRRYVIVWICVNVVVVAFFPIFPYFLIENKTNFHFLFIYKTNKKDEVEHQSPIHENFKYRNV